MAPDTTKADGYAGNRIERQARSGLIGHEEPREQRTAWLEDDFDAPEAWTLASFDDLVPYEMT